MQILFVTIDVSQQIDHVLNYFGVSKDDAPTVRIIDMESGKKYNIATEKYTKEALSQLCQEVVDGTAQVTHARTHTYTFRVSCVFCHLDYIITFYIVTCTYYKQMNASTCII